MGRVIYLNEMELERSRKCDSIFYRSGVCFNVGRDERPTVYRDVSDVYQDKSGPTNGGIN